MDKLDNSKYRIILENMPETSCMMVNLKSHLRGGIKKIQVHINCQYLDVRTGPFD